MKELIRKLIRRAGFDVRRYHPTSDGVEAFLRSAASCGVILDVGANEGQFAQLVLSRGWTGQIESYEPIGAAHAVLRERASAYPNWTVAPRMALGATPGTVELNISADSQSSSLLGMLPRQIRGAPAASYVGTETVRLDTLANVAPVEGPLALKMDVQGYEQQVLEGARPILDRVAVIWSEMSLQPLYDGEPLYTELGTFMIDLGYTCVGIFPGHYDRANGEMLQVDGLFVRA